MAFAYEEKQAYLRDGFVPFKEANLSVASSPILYGLSIYTVFALNVDQQSSKRYVYRLPEHYSRLVNSARIMDFHNFEVEWPYERFKQMALDLIKQNDINEAALVRVTVFIDELIAGTK